MARIQGKDVILKLSLDGVTYKEIVCETEHSYNRSRSTNQVETKCYGGVAFTSLGAKSGSTDYTGLFETQPSTTQVSGTEINTYFEDGTYLYWKEDTPGRYRQGRGYITDLSESASVGDAVQFSFTLMHDGDVDITA